MRCLPTDPFSNLSSIAPARTLLLLSLQQNGGGLLIRSGGTAALTTCALYENTLYTLYNNEGTVTLIETRVLVTPNAPKPFSYGLLN